MVKFKVVRAFKDIEHNQHKYKVGELYPAEGIIILVLNC